MMLLQLFAFAGAAIPARAVQLTFFESDDCSKGLLYGGKVDETLSCYSLEKHLDVIPGKSTSIQGIGSGQTVAFYSDSNCQQLLDQSDSDGCAAHLDPSAKAFQVFQTSVEVATRDASTSTSSFALSPYTGMEVAPQPEALPLSVLIIGVAVAAAAGWALQFVSTVRGCYSAYNTGDAASIENCNFDIGGTVLTMGAGAVAGTAGYRMRGRFQNMDGTVTNIPRRDLSGLLNERNSDYMASIMNETDSGALHIGYMQRDIGSGVLQTSPLWSVADSSGNFHKMTAFHNHETGEFVHSVFFGNATQLAKRDEPYAYDSLRDNDGGFDFKICDYNDGADRSVYQKRTEDLYDEITGDLRCLMSAEDLENAHGLATTFYNGDSTMLAQMFVTPFAHDGDGTFVDMFGSCGSIYNTRMDQSCEQ